MDICGFMCSMTNETDATRLSVRRSSTLVLNMIAWRASAIEARTKVSCSSGDPRMNDTFLIENGSSSIWLVTRMISRLRCSSSRVYSSMICLIRDSFGKLTINRWSLALDLPMPLRSLYLNCTNQSTSRPTDDVKAASPTTIMNMAVPTRAPTLSAEMSP